MSSFERMTRTRAYCKADTAIDDGMGITIPNAEITIRNRELFYTFKRFYGTDPGKVLEIFIAVGMSFAGFVLEHEKLTIDEILDAILKEGEE